jgi:hypothetical protein
MKTITFSVHLTFSGKVETDDDVIREIAKNIAESLKHTADTAGLSHEGSDEYIKEIAVSHSGTELVNLTLGI